MSATGRSTPEVGTLSADGSRVWDGRFWVLTDAGRRLDALPPLEARRQAAEISPDRRGYRLRGVVVAAVVGLILSFIPIPAPNPGSLQSALTELAVATSLRVLVTFVAVVVILSLGRQGLDVLLMRALLTVFLMASAVVGFMVTGLVLIQVPVTPAVPWPLVVLLVGLIAAVELGPVVAVFSVLANLLWYRSLESLRAQLGIIFRLVLAVALAANILVALWASVSGRNFGLWVLDGGPAALFLVGLFLLRKRASRTAPTAT